MMNSVPLTEIGPLSTAPEERNRRFIQNALELALSFGDFQKDVHNRCTHRDILAKTLDRIESLISFEASAIFLSDEESYDMHLSVCTPGDKEKAMEDELAFMIDQGLVAWAIRERRGVTILSKNGRRRILLHPMSTCSRTRGLFMGLFPEEMRRLPDTSLEILSLVLRYAANGIESLIFSNMLHQQKRELEENVAEKTKTLLQYEKQLLQAQNMEAIAALAGGVAHQFNNAMTGLIGYLDLLSIKVEKGTEAAAYLERIRPITDRMASLTNHLLAYAQGGKYVVSKISLKDFLSDVELSARRSIKSSVQLAVDSLADAPNIMVDKIQMRMALVAIISNGDEAIADEGTIHVGTHTVHTNDLEPAIGSELKSGKYVCVSIRDSGRGMDEDTLRRIFQPFFSTKFEGRGLTMAAVFGIIKNHSGWIAVTSKPGNGTTVDIYLPLADHEGS
jgi:C4-dicarboxylate-specific signal transduction histidine kinase